MSDIERIRREAIVNARAETWRRRAQGRAGRRAAVLRTAAALRLAASAPPSSRR